MLQDGVPLSFLGYSFGTLIAYECIKALEEKHSFRTTGFISLCGISQEFLRALPLYAADNGCDGGSSFEEKMRKSDLLMFGKTPNLVSSGVSDSDSQRYLSEGQSATF